MSDETVVVAVPRQVRVYLTRRNLTALLSKLDRVRAGGESAREIIKRDTVHPEYPCTFPTSVVALEDAEYYKDREAGEVFAADLPAEPPDAADLADRLRRRIPFDNNTLTPEAWLQVAETVIEVQREMADAKAQLAQAQVRSRD